MTDSRLSLPLPQSPEYARACEALGVSLRRAKREVRGEMRLCWQIQSRTFRPLGRIDLLSRGPVARDADDLAEWPDLWQRWHDGRPLLLNAEGIGASELQRAGFWPLMTPATLAMLPLSDPATMRAALHQKWRNRLNRAENVGLKVGRMYLSPAHWLLRAELLQSRQKGYRGLPPGLSAAFAATNPGKAVVFEARNRGAPVAALLILRHGRMATWQIGFSEPEGRSLNAMNLLLWEAMVWLGARGHDMLDLGIVNTDDARGLTHFKLGTGALTRRQNGTWLHMDALAPVARRLPIRLAA